MKGELKKDIESAVFVEFNRAVDKFGLANNSLHESYAVILEGFEETEIKANVFLYHLKQFWKHIKENNHIAAKEALIPMQSVAEKAAAEWIQVAAMCKKATFKKEDS